MLELVTDSTRPAEKKGRAPSAPTRAVAAAQAERERIASVRAALTEL